jgi:5-methylcytosine-specific restriction protein A
MLQRKTIFDNLKFKLEQAGFQFEREQKPYLQHRKEHELVFVHPSLVKTWELNGYKVHAKKFYIKPLTDEPNCEIGLVTGKSSPLYTVKEFGNSNAIDSFDGTPAWTNRENDMALDNLLSNINAYLQSPTLSLSKSTHTFLITWNPTKWEWTDLRENLDFLEKIGYIESSWSCGNSKNIKKGDRIFLMRVGKEPKGLMGSGYAKSSHYVAPHWDKTPGKTAHYIDIEFDVLINPEINNIFSKDLLDKVDPNNLQQWFPQRSGISIHTEIVDELESQWFDFITKNKLIKNSFLSNDVIHEVTESYTEGKSKEIIQTRYERNPQARKVCLTHHGYSCQICDFNFEYYFGEVGRGFIHVHHINPIATVGYEYNINPENDLIPVCPNCHAMIHSKTPPFTIDEIKKMRRTVGDND